MNSLDICVIGIVILSGLFAFARGFVRECLSIASWLGATAAAVYGLGYLRPIAERYVPKGAVADSVAAGAAFLVTLVVLTIITGAISRRVQRSSLSALDRTLGLVFGLMRGALLVTIGFLALSFVLPANGERPRWIAESRTAPLFASATSAFARYVPESFRQRAAQMSPQQDLQHQLFENALRAYSIPAARPGAAPPVPSAEDQQRLNRLFQQLGTGPETPPATGGDRIITVPPAR